jgi:Nucleotide-sugar transporter
MSVSSEADVREDSYLHNPFERAGGNSKPPFSMPANSTDEDHSAVSVHEAELAHSAATATATATPAAATEAGQEHMRVNPFHEDPRSVTQQSASRDHPAHAGDVNREHVDHRERRAAVDLTYGEHTNEHTGKHALGYMHAEKSSGSESESSDGEGGAALAEVRWRSWWWMRVFVVTNVVLISSSMVLISHSRVDGKLPFHPMAVTTMVELSKLVISLMVVLLKREPLRLRWRESVMYLVPAAVYGFDNNIVYFILLYYNSTTATILSNLKIVFTAVILRVVMKKLLTDVQWTALMFLVLGVVIAETESMEDEVGGWVCVDGL